jgi:hypothetical protein
MRDRLRCRFGGGCLNTGADIIIWSGVMVRRDRVIQLKVNSSKVKINIMLNRAGLLLINIYINDVRRRMLQQQHHFGEMIAYHASPACLVKTLTKDETWSIYHRTVNNRAICSIPTRIPITYISWNAPTCSF